MTFFSCLPCLLFLGNPILQGPILCFCHILFPNTKCYEKITSTKMCSLHTPAWRFPINFTGSHGATSIRDGRQAAQSRHWQRRLTWENYEEMRFVLRYVNFGSVYLLHCGMMVTLGTVNYNCPVNATATTVIQHFLCWKKVPLSRSAKISSNQLRS